jgi:hypothetical protein
MKREAAYAWAGASIIVPVVVLFDLNVLGGRLPIYHPFVILALWPSSFMLRGFSQVNAAAIVALLIALSINAFLYLALGFILSKALKLLHS